LEAIMRMLPAYLIAIVGSVADYVTTWIGLRMGYVETHPQYSPLASITIFTIAITVLGFALPSSPRWRLCVIFLSTWSFLGAVNNTLVILGAFSGLVI